MQSSSRNDCDVAATAEKLVATIATLEDAVVAFSGGVDSGVVAVAAQRALGIRCCVVQGTGEAVSSTDREAAEQLAKLCSLSLVTIATNEIEDPNYLRNDSRRCFYCKTTLYKTLRDWANTHGFKNILSGTNFDDLGDYRPGIEAAKQYSVVSPLADLRITKQQVRELARFWDLPIAEKPASPCLASRIAYGQEVTPSKLRLIEEGEAFLHGIGFRDVRVRLHAEDLVRLEFHRSDWHLLLEDSIRDAICRRFVSLGIQFVTMDLMSRQTGSFNRMLPIVS